MAAQAERLAITGMGVVSSVGNDLDTFFAALLEGRCGAQAVEAFRAEGLTHINAAAVSRPEVLARLSADEQEAAWGCAMGIVAARAALEDAGLEMTLGEGGLYANSVLGAPLAQEGNTFDWAEVTFEEPEMLARHGHGAKVARLARAVGASGEVQSFATTCAGNMALGSAADALREGRVPFALAGGFEEITTCCYLAFHQIHALADHCRPFDQDRGGLILADGAAFLVIEPMPHARARQARVYAELLAVGCSNDAYDLVAPDPEARGAILANDRALLAAGVSSSEVDYLNAHGTGTRLNDKTEAQTIRHVFGRSNQRLRISSTKGATGHPIGASSAIEAVATVLAIFRGQMPPTAGLLEIDPALELEGVLAAPSHEPTRVAVSHSFGFGGNNAVAVFAEPGRGEPTWATGPVYIKGAAAATAGTLGIEALGSRLAQDEPKSATPAEIEFSPAALLGDRGLRHVDRTGILMAATLANDLPAWPQGEPREIGGVIGVAHPSFEITLKLMRRIQAGGAARVHPSYVAHSSANSGSSWLLLRKGIQGHNATLTSADCAGLDAIAEGARQIERQRVRQMLVGGVFARCPELWAMLTPIRPGGALLAEGVGFLLLDADPQNAWAELASRASSFGKGLAAWERSCRIALERAALDRADLHLTPIGHLPGAARQTMAMVPWIGDTVAAGGAIAAVAGASLLKNGERGLRNVLVSVKSPEGFASALVLRSPKQAE